MRNQVGRAEFVGSYPKEVPELGLPEVAFGGRSNVGKSSLLNVLMRRKALARTSRTPGRTQTINLFKIGDACVFADLPGYGYAKVPEHVRAAWKPMVENYLGTRVALRLFVLLIDIRRDITEDEGALLWSLTEARIERLVVATKVDKVKPRERQRRLASLRKQLHLPAGLPLSFSATAREGHGAVWDAIEAAVRRGRH